MGVKASGELVSVLFLLAHVKYGPYDDDLYLCYWKDKNWRNESFDNVCVARRRRMGPGAHTHSYGFPSSTPEYRRAYYNANKDKFKANQLRWRLKSKTRIEALEAELREAKLLLAGVTPADPDLEREFMDNLFAPRNAERASPSTPLIAPFDETEAERAFVASLTQPVPTDGDSNAS